MDSTIIVTAFLSALFGITVFVIRQLIQKLLIEPVQEQRKIIGEIAHALADYANVNDVSRRRREISALLELHSPFVCGDGVTEDGEKMGVGEDGG